MLISNLKKYKLDCKTININIIYIHNYIYILNVCMCVRVYTHSIVYMYIVEEGVKVLNTFCSSSPAFTPYVKNTVHQWGMGKVFSNLQYHWLVVKFESTSANTIGQCLCSFT